MFGTVLVGCATTESAVSIAVFPAPESGGEICAGATGKGTVRFKSTTFLVERKANPWMA